MTTNNVKKYCLYAGRHELPANEGPLFLDFDFQKFEPLATEKYFEALEELEKSKLIIEKFLAFKKWAITIIQTN